MRKVVVHRPGGFERLVVEEHPDPEPGPDEVVVDVEAAGVNFADVAVRMGLYASAKEYVGWPITPGFEFAGRADGEPVFGVTRFGAYASRLAVARGQVFPLPDGWSAEQAAGFPTVFLTAWYALHSLLAVRAGMVLLVHSAAGGVGGALLQLGRIAGARLVAVVGAPHKVETARALGADVVIDKSAEPLWPAAERAAPEGYDGVLDANGVETLRASYDHLAPEGRLVVYGFHTMLPKGRGRPPRWRLALDYLRTPRFHPLAMTTENRSVMAFNLSFLFDRTDALEQAMEQLLAHAGAGRIRPPAIETFPLDDVAAAHRRLQSGETVGKLVLIP